MTPSQLLMLAKSKLATPENVNSETHINWICEALEDVAVMVRNSNRDTLDDLEMEIVKRIQSEVTALAPGFSSYPASLAVSLGIEASDEQWRQKVRHEFVDRLIAEYEAAGR